ncbi:MAG: hydantoinase/oxoprolinase family protein [Roseovarius sp.]|nr:hydantoinase/oxoprolinase family protein [Roseovarius sp.]
MTNPPLRLAIDIGGTFTDTVLMEGAGDILASTKTLTTHADPSQAALAGAARALEQAGRAFDQVTGFVHGTTLATNALIERRGAKVATVTTEGFRDILEIAYERRYDQYDIMLEKPDLLVPRDLSFSVSERMDAAGRVLIALDPASVGGVIESLRGAGVEALAICLMHAYANPAHELALRDAVQAALPDLSISLSSEVSPEAREFDRLCTTVANAYIQPLMCRYLDGFRQSFAQAGVRCPVLMMTAGGGMTTLQTAMRFPIRLVESGPAGGAILAARIAAEAGLDEVLSFDMGGTTAKLCLIDGARPQTARQFEIARAARFIKGSGMPVRIPVIEMIEIGAGGGSIAAVDRLGRLIVGPQSAGSEPGPAAYGNGGTHATVTDADIALGYIRPENFAEGRFQIDRHAAEAALTAEIGSALGLEAGDAADGVSRIVDESMASAGRMHAVESGKDLGARTMIAFGGNGPLHATRVARSAGITRVVVPPNPSVGSAVGFLFAPVAFEIVRSHYALLESLDLAGLNTLLDAMSAEARALVRLGAPTGPLELRRAAFMRYHGQGHEIEIALPLRALDADDIPGLQEAFEAAYRVQFSRPVPGMQIEILNWSVAVSTVSDTVPGRPSAAAPCDRAGDTHVPIICDVDGSPQQAQVIERATLAPGDRITGPALITEPQTTTLVSRDFTCCVDGSGNLVLDRQIHGANP